VARDLAAGGIDVRLTGGPDETALCAGIAEAAGLPPTASTAGSLDLPGLAELVGTSRLLVCGDTGVAHLATALRTPSVLLFGPVSPRVWGPAIDLDRHLVLWHGDGTGDPHGSTIDPALLRISVPEVLDAVRPLLRG
jgi:ADP-heptose:LPS heptosyltransferase